MLLDPERYVPIAVVARPHGVRGELRVHVFNDDSSLLFEVPVVHVKLSKGHELDVVIAHARPATKAVLVKLENVDDRDAADAYRGAEISVRRKSFPKLPAGEFYACDVEGARVVLPGGESVGRVRVLQRYPTCDVFVIETSERVLEVPLLPHYVSRVDVDRAEIEVVTLDGL